MIVLPTKSLKAAFHCAAKSDIRYYLNGVLIERTKSGNTYVVSTDGHCVFVASLIDSQVECSEDGPWQIIVPTDIIKNLKTKNPKTSIQRLEGKYVLDNTLFDAVDGKYPDWRRVIPNDEANQKQARQQFNPSLVVRCSDALNIWNETKDHYSNVIIEKATSAIMRGPSCLAFCVIMPYRANLQEYSDIVSINSYE